MPSKLSIQNVIKVAFSRGGVVLDGIYNNQNSEFVLKCHLGHMWTTKASNLFNGHWCHMCSGQMKLSIEEMRAIAKSRNGLCLSKNYFNINTKLKWQCENNHIWDATPDMIKRGTWCPQCNIHVSEEICRLYMEYIFQKPFIKIRPNWLRSPANYPLELDGYNAELNIAFEHQGPHHYDPFIYGGNRHTNYEKIIQYDSIKKNILQDRNIKLIVIPTLFSLIELDHLFNFIKNECIIQNILCQNNENDIILDISKVYSKSIINKYIDIAQKNNGKLIAYTFIGTQRKCIWECYNNHTWEATPNSIGNGSWCPQCSSKKLNINLAKQIAKDKNGICLSEIYINKREKLLWQCNVCKNIWSANLGNIKNKGTWCPTCHKKGRKSKCSTY